jgi:dihydrofolate reductase
MPKYVVSTTLTDPEWENTRVISGDVAAEIERLKAADGRDIVQYGYGVVTRLLLERDLLDEVRLWFHPLILGRGEPADLLFGPAPASAWQLVDTTALSSGIVILSYAFDRRLDG